MASGNVWRLEIRLCLKRSSRCSYVTGRHVTPQIKPRRSSCRPALPHTDTHTQTHVEDKCLQEAFAIPQCRRRRTVEADRAPAFFKGCGSRLQHLDFGRMLDVAFHLQTYDHNPPVLRSLRCGMKKKCFALTNSDSYIGDGRALFFFFRVV